MIKKSDYHYELPERLIAQTPLQDRSASRLLVVDRQTGDLRHTYFKDITGFLREGDCLVLNNTKVIPARLIGERADTGGRAELLLLNRLDAFRWEVLAKPGKRIRQGSRLIFGSGLLTAEILDVLDTGNRIVRFFFNGIFEEILDQLGEMPLPPYIKEKLEDRNRYQTVYAKVEGSAAAPTAGLHFTEELLQEIVERKIGIATITLHVGLGTFRPVKTENILDHTMHSEYYTISPDQAERINRAKKMADGLSRLAQQAAGRWNPPPGRMDCLRGRPGRQSCLFTQGIHLK